MKFTREAQKEYNAEMYPASVLKWMNEATDRAFNIFEKIKTCENCKQYRNSCNLCYVLDRETSEDFGCNSWEAR